MKFNSFEYINKIPNKAVKHRLLDRFMDFLVPFNRPLKLHIHELSKDKVSLISPETRKRHNHVKGAHACALALIGEYAAGLIIAQNYSPQDYRIIIGQLSIDYHKQGRGTLTSTALAPQSWLEKQPGEVWAKLESIITNSNDETVAVCNTQWQIKGWGQIKKP